MMAPIQVRTDPDGYVLVTIPLSLEASARVAIADLYQPFFVEWAQGGIVLVTRAAEWQRVAARFPGAITQDGFRLISLGLASAAGPPDPDGPPPLAAADLAALVRHLEQRGIRGRTLRSFYHDHLLVAEEHLAACLKVLTAFPGVSPGPSSGG